MSSGSSSGIPNGTNGSQGSLEQINSELQATENELRVKTEALIAELERSNIRFTKQNIVFITKDTTGQIVWLEKGNQFAGLEHIIKGNGRTPGHVSDFKKAFGVSEERIPSFLNNVISHGNVVSNTIKTVNGRIGFERIYYYDGKHYLLAGIGSNGFIVSAYPIEY